MINLILNINKVLALERYIVRYIRMYMDRRMNMLSNGDKERMSNYNNTSQGQSDQQ